jgi:hypothetical protein
MIPNLCSFRRSLGVVVAQVDDLGGGQVGAVHVKGGGISVMGTRGIVGQIDEIRTRLGE